MVKSSKKRKTIVLFIFYFFGGLFFGFTFLTLFEYVQLIIELIGIAIGKSIGLCLKSRAKNNKVAGYENNTAGPRMSASEKQQLNMSANAKESNISISEGLARNSPNASA